MSYTMNISFVIPTYNSGQTIKECLASIRSQDYPQEKVEIVICDGGSQDQTRSLCAPFQVKIIDNPWTIHPKGRPLGIAQSSGEIVCCLDSDNVLPETTWISKMIHPFADPEVAAAEPIAYTARKKDSLCTKYCAAIGGDDPIAVYLGYFDRMSLLQKDWTKVPREETVKDGYIKVRFSDAQRIPPLGANGFMVRKHLLQEIRYDPFLHVDIAHQLIKKGHAIWAKVKTGLHHIHAQDLKKFIQKKKRRVLRRMDRESIPFYSYPFSPQDWLSLGARLALFFPVCQDALRLSQIDPNLPWFHVKATYQIFFLYAYNRIRGPFLRFSDKIYEKV